MTIHLTPQEDRMSEGIRIVGTAVMQALETVTDQPQACIMAGTATVLGALLKSGEAPETDFMRAMGIIRAMIRDELQER